MKTAEELFADHCIEGHSFNYGYMEAYLTNKEFKLAITEDRQQIISKIDEMILQAKIFQYSKYKNIVAGQVKVLTELKNFIEEKK